MRMNRVRVGVIMASAAAAALAIWLTTIRESSLERSPAPLKEAPEVVKEATQKAADPATAEPLRAPVPEIAPIVDLGRGMVDPNPLAFVAQQHALAKPGSFAIAEQVVTQCRQANQSASKARVEKALQRATALGKDTATFQARFIEAQQTIQSRCNDFRQELGVETPLSNDAFATAFLEARSGTLNPDGDYVKNLAILAQQGQLASAYQSLATVWKFQGEDFKSDEDKHIFHDAVYIAAFNSTSIEGRRDKDLRTLTGCVSTGICDGTYDSLVLYHWPTGAPQREKAQTLAKRMEVVFRTNDIQAWIRKP